MGVYVAVQAKQKDEWIEGLKKKKDILRLEHDEFDKKQMRVTVFSCRQNGDSWYTECEKCKKFSYENCVKLTGEYSNLLATAVRLYVMGS